MSQARNLANLGVHTTTSAGAVTFAAGTNECFASFAAKDYTLSVLTAGGGSAIAGDIILLTDSKRYE